MRKTLAAMAGLFCVTTLAVTATGCGSSGSGSAAPSVSMGASGVDQLRTIFQQAEDSKQTVVETISAGQSAGVAPTTCKIQLHPTSASDCTQPNADGQGGDMRKITLPDASYTFDNDPDLQFNGKWHKDTTQSGASQSTDLSQTGGDGGVFTPGTGTVTATASDQVNGKPCTRYNIALNFDKLIQAQLSRDNGGAPANTPDPLAQVSEGGTASGQIWIGSDGLPAQTSVTIVFKDQPSQTQNYTYSNWGQPVSIQPPPADQIAAGSGN